MAKHKILVNLPEAEVQNSDAEFEIRANGRKLGKLTISRGGLGWKSHKRKRKEIHLPWERFDQCMKDQE